MAYESLGSTTDYLRELRDRLVAGVRRAVPDARVTGHPDRRLPSFASFVVPGIEGESMLLALDARNVFASSGSACTSGTLEPSHVLTAMGIGADLAHGSLRLTTGLTNTPEQIDRAVEALGEVVTKLRSLAPARNLPTPR
jgi:cysteine desulfurase